MTIERSHCATKTCLCTMCRCGDHMCPQQIAHNLPQTLRDLGNEEPSSWRHDPEKKKQICQSYERLPESTMYSSTTYKEDFKIHPDIAGPPETARLVSTLKCEKYPMERGSTYSRDFIPWPEKDMEFCRSKLNKPDVDTQHLAGATHPLDLQNLKPFAFQSLKHYYCPPHCAGTDKTQKAANCLIPYKDKFNLGPPKPKVHETVHKPHQAFAKHTNYMLDYLPYKIQARLFPEIKERKIVPSLPSSFDTTHKKDFIWPPEGYKKPEKGKAKEEKPGLKVEDGPMTDQSNSMLDYKDPKVTERMPVRPPKEVFRPPVCRMETETTSKASYPRWKELPTQAVAKPLKQDRCEPAKSDVRFLVTTYQEDFDGLCAALCPAKTVENYGRRAVEPKYRFLCTGNDHEYFDQECGDKLDTTTCIQSNLS